MSDPARSGALPRQIVARRLYDGSGAPARSDMVISHDGARITEVAPYNAQTHGPALPCVAIATPGLIDIQINGAKDVQFNDQPDLGALRLMAEGAAEGGTAYILPTFVTANDRAFEAALVAARAAIAAGLPGILGLHLEGPFLSPKRPGIHDKTAIRPMNDADIAALTAPFPGPLLLTLAPEEAQAGQIAALTAAGVTVFAGHSEASYAQMQAARAEGLCGATHLFNAMSQMQGRAPGVVGAVLHDPALYAGIIADGHHVHWANLALAISLMPKRLCLVTDAMCTLAGARQSFDLHGETITLKGGRLTNADGTLAGAHIAMDKSLRNVITRGLATPECAVRMASLNPARALGVDDRIGRIRAGYQACISVFDTEWQAQAVLRA